MDVGSGSAVLIKCAIGCRIFHEVDSVYSLNTGVIQRRVAMECTLVLRVPF